MPTAIALRPFFTGLPARLRARLQALAPGVAVCLAVALSATFLSEHYGGPQLLYALLIGLAFHFLMAHPHVAMGVNFCSRTLLRTGVALLGARITWGQVAHLGAVSAGVVVLAVALTIGVGLLAARWLRRPVEEGLLSGCAVGICGASAALAISSVLPPTRENERFTLLAVVGVTLLSTLAMVIYPFCLHLLQLPAAQAGIFLGGTVHDVAQVVAAGMMLSPAAGENAVVVKLFRVMLLAPVAFLVAAAWRRRAALARDASPAPATRATGAARPPLLPVFLVAFLVLVVLASLGAFPPAVASAAGDTSRWLLVIAIAAAGVKTTFEELFSLGWRPMALLLGETLFIAVFVLAAILLFHLGA